MYFVARTPLGGATTKFYEVRRSPVSKSKKLHHNDVPPLTFNVKHEHFKIPEVRVNFVGKDPHPDHTLYDHPTLHHQLSKQPVQIGFLHSATRHTTTLTSFDPQLQRMFAQPTNKLHRRGYTTASRDILKVVEEAQNGQRSFKVSLPLRDRTKTLFSFRGDQTIKNILSDIKEEEPSLRSLSLRSKEGERFSQATRLEDAIAHQSLQLELDGKVFDVEVTQTQGGRSPMLIQAVTGVVHPITESELEQMKTEFLNLYAQKRQLDINAKRFGNGVIYVGLIYLCAQWAVMARLTWWEFNWDIMEPITYFLTFGTAIIGYIYFTFTKREYTFGDLRDSVIHNRMFRNYIKNDFDVDRYFLLEHRLQRYDPDFIESVDTLVDEQQHKKRDLLNTQPA